MHVPLVAVRVYSVVTDGDASGFNIDELLRPVTGDHEKEVPFDEALNVFFVPSQIVKSLPAFTVSVFICPTVTGKVVVQPLASFTITV